MEYFYIIHHMLTGIINLEIKDGKHNQLEIQGFYDSKTCDMLLLKLIEEGYVTGIPCILSDSGRKKVDWVSPYLMPTITLAGLEYLVTNPMMLKAERHKEDLELYKKESQQEKKKPDEASVSAAAQIIANNIEKFGK